MGKYQGFSSLLWSTSTWWWLLWWLAWVWGLEAHKVGHKTLSILEESGDRLSAFGTRGLCPDTISEDTNDSSDIGLVAELGLGTLTDVTSEVVNVSFAGLTHHRFACLLIVAMLGELKSRFNWRFLLFGGWDEFVVNANNAVFDSIVTAWVADLIVENLAD